MGGLVRGLWVRGCVAHMQRSAVWAAVQLACYDQCKQLVLRSGIAKEGIGLYFASSSVASFITVSVTHPLDQAKSRLMNVSAAQSQYSSLWDCLRQIAMKEGPRGLFKGWLPNYARSSPHATILFVVFDSIMSRTPFGTL